jgi:hypothetical protein
MGKDGFFTTSCLNCVFFLDSGKLWSDFQLLKKRLKIQVFEPRVSNRYGKYLIVSDQKCSNIVSRGWTKFWRIIVVRKYIVSQADAKSWLLPVLTFVMIHYIWYDKISLAYKLSISDEILFCYFGALYQGFIIEKTEGSTMVRFVGDPR